MRILIEGCPYKYEVVKDIVPLGDKWSSVEKDVLMPYVGYFYNPTLADCVFILPKVVLDADNKVFGKYAPEDIIDIKDLQGSADAEAERKLLYTLSVWIHRAIVVYKNGKGNDTSIVKEEQVSQVGKGRRRLSNTFLDILLALLQFNKDNQNWVLFITKNLHSGYNKINWTRTISKSECLVQEKNGHQSVVYMNPVNKKRSINFDEELLIIYYSVLQHLHDHYGFPVTINVNFPLLRGKQFERYLSGYGIRRLRQIKYKYFSDKALLLWELCYAFFAKSHDLFVNVNNKDYLLVSKFDRVFESIIDTLIGDDPLPDGMDKEQRDGKIVDHLYTAKSLIENEGNTYYIGDSKYYKLSGELDDTSVYKQYTYARNVIQWNLNIFNGENKNVRRSDVKLRDDAPEGYNTEGYNIIPNFFISARIDESYRYDVEGVQESDKKNTRHRNYQFKNRLFDRDTLLLFHYDVNFLFVLSLYGKNNSSEIGRWKEKIREKFRETIQQWLQEDFDFYAMQPHPGVDTKAYIHSHFKEVIGKVYTPFNDGSILSLALDKGTEFETENEQLLTELRKSFYVVECGLGENPEAKIAEAKATAKGVACNPDKAGVLMVMMEDYATKSAAFLESGKIAIGIQYTKDSMEIVEHLQTIGFVLFHHRNDTDQHLFRVNGSCKVIGTDELGDYYPDISTAQMFVAVELGEELDPTSVKCSKKKFEPSARCDAQYASVEELADSLIPNSNNFICVE